MPVSHLPGEALVVRHVVVVSAEDLLALVWAHCTWPPPHKGHPQTCYAGHQAGARNASMLLQSMLLHATINAATTNTTRSTH